MKKKIDKNILMGCCQRNYILLCFAHWGLCKMVAILQTIFFKCLLFLQWKSSYWSSPTHSFNQSINQLITGSLTQGLTHSLTHSFTHSLTHSPTHPLTHTPTHSLNLSTKLRINDYFWCLFSSACSLGCRPWYDGGSLCSHSVVIRPQVFFTNNLLPQYPYHMTFVFYFDLNIPNLFKPQFCTCHGSAAAMTCAKLWLNK